MTATQHYESIDDYLGPNESRFFGAGHRRVRHVMRDVIVGHQGDSRPLATATAGVEYPFDWSSKAASGYLRPHLSTIDALLFGVQLTELCVATTYDLTDAHRRTMWLRRVDIRAGSAPDEDDLDAFGVDAELVGTEQSAAGAVSTVVCRIGRMKIRCQVEHEPAAAARPGFRKVRPADARARLFNDGYKSRVQSIADVRVDRRAVRAEALVRVDSLADEVLPGEGLEAAYRPHISMIDSFVVALQLGQVLLYELDGFDRGDSDTLWMRRTTMVADTPVRPSGEAFRVTTGLIGTKLVEARGGVWRTADIIAECPGLRLECSVTHRLPAGTFADDVIRVPLDHDPNGVSA
ncbi:AvrD family protein [Actinosynnema sp. NPDC053489]|uniref:AvrD family protein n=1 Tax=Actinosynnema sp. NPDC053489 TaxID=3363916 RepID=UPI0037C8960A